MGASDGDGAPRSEKSDGARSRLIALRRRSRRRPERRQTRARGRDHPRKRVDGRERRGKEAAHAGCQYSGCGDREVIAVERRRLECAPEGAAACGHA
jgi:hypothetical protein